MHAADADTPHETGGRDALRQAAMQVAIHLYRRELLMAAGFLAGEDPDRLLYEIVRHAERLHARDHGVDRRAIVMNPRFRKQLIDTIHPSPEDDVDQLINEILEETERLYICGIIGADIHIHTTEQHQRRPRRRDDDGTSAAS